MVCQRWLKSKRDVLLPSLFKENPVRAVNVLDRAPAQLTHTGVNVTTYLQQKSDLEDKKTVAIKKIPRKLNLIYPAVHHHLLRLLQGLVGHRRGLPAAKEALTLLEGACVSVR